MIRRRFHHKETIATILAEEESHIDAARRGMLQARQELERHIAGDPFFQSTFEPYKVNSESRTVQRMSRAGISAGVGPMAAVAGAIAWAGVEEMEESGAVFGMVDNGGDIALMTDREVLVGLHAGDSALSDRYAFRVLPYHGIRGICTSSATVGPSISLGVADAVTVFSDDAALADAWATAICNEITPQSTGVLQRPDPQEVSGVFVVIGEWTCVHGTVPELVRARVDHALISGGPF